MLKLDRLITLTRLNAELLHHRTVNEYGELDGGSPDTTVTVWAQTRDYIRR